MQTVKLAEGFEIVCAFVNDSLCEEVLVELAKGGTKIIAMRCAGFNNVDLVAAKRLGMQVVNVPAYSPESVAEHTVALMLTLNRKIHKAYQRTRDANFSLEGLVGFNMFGKTVGVIGTGKIGVATIKVLLGFGCKVIAYDPFINPAVVALNVEYQDLDAIYANSDIISLHCPLTADNRHLLNQASFAKMKPGVIILNCARGEIVHTADIVAALQSGHVGGYGTDVLDQEPPPADHPLLKLPNCIVTPHIGSRTHESVQRQASCAVENLTRFLAGQPPIAQANKF